MKPIPFLILTLLAAGSLVIKATAALPPSLQPHADRFEKDRAALLAAGENHLKPPRERYLAALASAEKEAAARGASGDSVAIAAEIRDVGADSLADRTPPDLPRSLSQPRRDYLAARATVAKTVPVKLRDLADRYLRVLSEFEGSGLNPADPAILATVAAEKQRVLDLLQMAGGAAKHQNVVANSDFSLGAPGQMPPSWRAEAEIPVVDATTVADGASRFLRFRRLQPLRRANLLPEKEVTIPERARSVEFSVKLRIEGLVPGRDYDTHPGAHITGRDSRGEEAGGGWAVVKEDTGWKRFQIRFPLEPSAKTLRIAIGPFGSAGIFDVDDIEVEFK